ncbi:NUDIX hydrolase [Nocardia terpenica]|uniref:NUDIX hydrolase n=1 Tax=Nocardia terpenica TaxID=455432 RepID=A0A161XBD4_9NOCA|nr:NUDIX hydrolase [Nocardia terpenica]KZM70468.1 NUDIX hydrolase [Nocardia terpenica]MBF6063537.1 NUDIX hydrolase [Nocardia terpenica]MBF6106093.1 NUDIX hydrolase [Nocardia terpenica]MBF6113322.1 NUDIX hydrolase [Nocardia terpenica]MBF6119834.1 NUDIX hydrolase [Nocardia terpenica]
MNSVQQPQWERDPEGYRAHLAQGNARQARKRVGADALIVDREGRILLVDPNYKPDWDLPGGMAEANEAPDQAVRRELREELGLHLDTDLALLCVDWVSPHGPWDDSIMFIFDTGTLSAERIDTLEITDHELDAFEFCTAEQAEQRLRTYMWSRVQAALQARETKKVVYLHNGKVTC